jgi:predicted protein tyrosine phosphatase
MKILCICARGNSRSVALGWILKDHLGHDAIAMGIEVASPETQNMLFDWAEKIILVDKTFENKIPNKYKNKLKIWDVGGDRFFRGFEPELLNMYTNYLNTEGL